jgi:hypothetical protein
MSWFLQTVVGGVASIFSGTSENEEKEEKKKKKKRVRPDQADTQQVPSAVSPSTRSARARSDSETKRALSDTVFVSMSKRDRDAVMLSLWESAYRRAPNKYLNDALRQQLLRDVSDQCLLPGLTFHALSQRISNIQKRGSVARAPGSGRPRMFTEEHANAAREVARAYNGDISRSSIFETVAEKFGSEHVNKRSQFLYWLTEIFKRRRIRYKPTLSDEQKFARVAYAQHSISTDFSEENRTIFGDEKRFEAGSVGVYNLPVEDTTPTRRIQSRSNPVFVMVLVVVAAPRGRWNGVIGMHFFVQRVAAANKSKNREAGTMELHAINVSKETYVAAWVDSIIPAISEAIRSGNLPNPTAAKPLLLQDDNATPHRGPYSHGIDVTAFICVEAQRTGIFMVPKRPAQPAQSPDLNPLDTFIFRVLATKWRRLRARDLVRQMATYRARLESSAGQEPSASRGAVRRIDFDDYDGGDDSDGGDGAPSFERTVPLRCKPEGTRKRALCRGCSGLVKQNDKTAVQCELRFGWWHLECVKELTGTDLYPRAVLPDLQSEDVWICPQCSMHLCRNDDKTGNLCLMCWKPSLRKW